MSTRKIKGNLPDVQERLLLTLYALHQKHALDYCVSGNPADYDGKPYFLGSAISLVLGGGWSHYRHNQMVELSKNGWVVISIATGNKWSYALTETALATMSDRFSRAVSKSVNSVKVEGLGF